MRPRRPRPRAKKSLGQHFLVDPNIQRRIVEALDAKPADEVLEIGPGTGALTRHLAQTGARLILVELDDRLVRELEDRYGPAPEVRVLHVDFLATHLPELSADPASLKVVGNIPYNVTAPILFKLLERPRPREILLMVQKEVAQRLAARPGTSQYGALSVGVQSVAEVEIVMKVPRTAFRPVPRVDSAMVRIRPLAPPPLGPDEESRLRTLTRVAFGWRRKQFQKILRDHPEISLDAETVKRIASHTGMDLSRRPEAFSPEELITLSRHLSRVRGGAARA